MRDTEGSWINSLRTDRCQCGAFEIMGSMFRLADMIVPKRFEFYGGTSYIFGQYGRSEGISSLEAIIIHGTHGTSG